MCTMLMMQFYLEGLGAAGAASTTTGGAAKALRRPSSLLEYLRIVVPGACRPSFM